MKSMPLPMYIAFSKKQIQTRCLDIHNHLEYELDQTSPAQTACACH